MYIFNNIDHFEGSLYDLLEKCTKFLPPKDRLIKAQEWLINQFYGETLFLRKYKGHNIRGKTYSHDGIEFVAVDNEPLNSLYEFLQSNDIDTEKSFNQYLKNKIFHLSWYLDEGFDLRKDLYKIGGVKTSYRTDNYKFKLAHIFDAAKGLSSNDPKLRFFRSLNPINIFPFPSSRTFDFTQDFTDKSDIAEVEEVQKYMFAYINHYISDTNAIDKFLLHSNHQGWRDVDLQNAKNIKLKVTRKDLSKTKSTSTSNKLKKTNTNKDANRKDPCPKLLKKEALKNIDELYVHLKTWISTNPKTDYVAGKKDSNGWVRFYHPIEFDIDDAEDYKGVCWVIKGDTKLQAIKDFVYLYESSISEEDILIPSRSNQLNHPILKLGADPSIAGTSFFCFVNGN